MKYLYYINEYLNNDLFYKEVSNVDIKELKLDKFTSHELELLINPYKIYYNNVNDGWLQFYCGSLVNVYKMDDEWFYVNYNDKWFKCDQIDGLINCLNDNIKGYIDTEFIDKFLEIIKDLKKINKDVYNKDGQEYIYYNSDKEWVFYQDLKNREFWCSSKTYWSFFESSKLGNHQQIQPFTKYMVQQALKLEDFTPICLIASSSIPVQQALKLEDFTPLSTSIPVSSWVQQALQIRGFHTKERLCKSAG